MCAKELRPGAAGPWDWARNAQQRLQKALGTQLCESRFYSDSSATKPRLHVLNPRLLLAVLPSTIEAPVQVPYPLVEFVVVLYKHPISHHLLLADAPLQLVPPPASQPLGPHNEVLWVDLEVT